MHRWGVRTDVPTSPGPHAFRMMAIMPLCSNMALPCRVDDGRVKKFVKEEFQNRLACELAL